MSKLKKRKRNGYGHTVEAVIDGGFVYLKDGEEEPDNLDDIVFKYDGGDNDPREVHVWDTDKGKSTDQREGWAIVCKQVGPRSGFPFTVTIHDPKDLPKMVDGKKFKLKNLTGIRNRYDHQYYFRADGLEEVTNDELR